MQMAPTRMRRRLTSKKLKWRMHWEIPPSAVLHVLDISNNRSPYCLHVQPLIWGNAATEVGKLLLRNHGILLLRSISSSTQDISLFPANTTPSLHPITAGAWPRSGRPGAELMQHMWGGGPNWNPMHGPLSLVPLGASSSIQACSETSEPFRPGALLSCLEYGAGSGLSAPLGLCCHSQVVKAWLISPGEPLLNCVLRRTGAFPGPLAIHKLYHCVRAETQLSFRR